MALLFCDSFDHYTTPSQKWDSALGPNVTIATAAARNGSNGLKMVHNFNTNNHVIKNVTPAATGFVGFAFLVNNYSDPAPIVVAAFMDGSTYQVGISINSTGQFSASCNGTLLGTASAAMGFGAWHYVEVKATISATVGVVVLKVDGVTLINLTGQNTKGSANATFSGIQLGMTGNIGGSSITVYYDDVYYCDASGSFNNTYLGDIAIKCVFPTANGTTNNFTLGGSTPAATNWQSVKETVPDDGVTYVADGTLNDIDRYTFPAITGNTVLAAVINMRTTKDDATARSVRGAIKSSSTTGDTGTDLVVTQTTYADLQGISESDPNTSAIWTVTNFNAAEFGVKVTL
jgi:hypothetical protein